MQIPTPNEFAKERGHNPFPPRWEGWLSQVRQAILSAQPQAGRYVTTDEHPGKGTVVNVADSRLPTPTPQPTGCPASITFSGIEFCCGCYVAGDARVLFYEDVGGGSYINDREVSLQDITVGECETCQNAGVEEVDLPSYYNGSTDCPTPESHESDLLGTIDIYVAFIGGIWYVAVIEHDTGRNILFYGTTSDPNSPIGNEIVDCTTSPEVFDNPLINCLSIAGEPLCSVGINGTATLTF